MNGQNPNNQVNQSNTNQQDGGINSSVLGSVVGPTPSTSTPQVAQQNPTPAEQPATTLNQTPVVGEQVANTNPEVSNAQNIQAETLTSPVNTNPAEGTVADTQTEALNPEPLASSPSPIAQPIPGTSGTPYQANSLTGDTVGVGTPNVGQENLNSNAFVEPTKVENIGITPPANNPINNQTKKKKPMNKVLFVIIIIVLMAAVAFGVYYFLNISNKVTVNTKDVQIGIGETLSDNINDYATITGSKAGTCTLNNRNVNTTVAGEYEFTITCGEESYTGKITVADLEAPSVSLNTVYKVVNESVTVDEFIDECSDMSNCTSNFVDENAVNTNLATAGGPYDVAINVADEAGNSKEVTGKLYVTPYSIQVFRSCESPSSNVDNYQATKTTTDYLPIGNDTTNGLVYLGVSQRIYTYTFTDAGSYESVVADHPDTLTFDGITGTASYNDDDLTFQITTDLSLETLNSEAGGTFPTTYEELSVYYNNLQYTCNNTLNNAE